MPLTTGWPSKAGITLGLRHLETFADVLGAGGRRQRQVEYRGFTAAGELRYPVIRGWYRS
jgi:hypothetical protein